MTTVNPTYVGMNPDQLKTTAEDKGEPHVCGDEPGTESCGCTEPK